MVSVSLWPGLSASGVWTGKGDSLRSRLASKNKSCAISRTNSRKPFGSVVRLRKRASLCSMSGCSEMWTAGGMVPLLS
jgi:hypothetical protein